MPVALRSTSSERAFTLQASNNILRVQLQEEAGKVPSSATVATTESNHCIVTLRDRVSRHRGHCRSCR